MKNFYVYPCEHNDRGYVFEADSLDDAINIARQREYDYCCTNCATIDYADLDVFIQYSITVRELKISCKESAIPFYDVRPKFSPVAGPKQGLLTIEVSHSYEPNKNDRLI